LQVLVWGMACATCKSVFFVRCQLIFIGDNLDALAWAELSV
jgi:hypothetical protein